MRLLHSSTPDVILGHVQDHCTFMREARCFKDAWTKINIARIIVELLPTKRRLPPHRQAILPHRRRHCHKSIALREARKSTPTNSQHLIYSNHSHRSNLSLQQFENPRPSPGKQFLPEFIEILAPSLHRCQYEKCSKPTPANPKTIPASGPSAPSILTTTRGSTLNQRHFGPERLKNGTVVLTWTATDTPEKVASDFWHQPHPGWMQGDVRDMEDYDDEMNGSCGLSLSIINNTYSARS